MPYGVDDITMDQLTAGEKEHLRKRYNRDGTFRVPFSAPDQPKKTVLKRDLLPQRIGFLQAVADSWYAPDGSAKEEYEWALDHGLIYSPLTQTLKLTPYGVRVLSDGIGESDDCPAEETVRYKNSVDPLLKG